MKGRNVERRIGRHRGEKAAEVIQDQYPDLVNAVTVVDGNRRKEV